MCAPRAGAGLVAGARTGAHGDEAFRAAGATHVLDSAAGLPALLRGRADGHPLRHGHRGLRR
ncbi:hypothetical protein VT50_0205355 [Streptomyces antioxidans]|uniref:Uncharacterized protein n=1 Tax=Streptomyces antioxidans TaxID=1507734 RepID=A0A1V4DAH3_9ACTN|nr:hypothetical protein VT50_0205355 [Streptomyces antioxidans]